MGGATGSGKNLPEYNANTSGVGLGLGLGEADGGASPAHGHGARPDFNRDKSGLSMADFDREKKAREKVEQGARVA